MKACAGGSNVFQALADSANFALYASSMISLSGLRPRDPSLVFPTLGARRFAGRMSTSRVVPGLEVARQAGRNAPPFGSDPSRASSVSHLTNVAVKYNCYLGGYVMKKGK